MMDWIDYLLLFVGGVLFFWAAFVIYLDMLGGGDE
jgi:hypothetical protein